MDKKEIDKILKEHKNWLNGEGGERADLRGADLRRADLWGADLRRADLQGAYLRRADLRDADLRGANLQDANLQRANLQDANLRLANLRHADLLDADLRGADLDYSVFPLWCGSKGMIVDIKFARQLLAHVCTLDCQDSEFDEIKDVILPYAMKSHRSKDLGLEERNG